jgi:signal transduction histidine kinase
MQERAAYLGGKIKITTGFGKGTTINVVLPKSPMPEIDARTNEMANVEV